MIHSAQRLAALKKLASGATLTEFAEELLECLGLSFAETMEFVKTQKVLTRFRDVEALKRLRATVLGSALQLGTEERAALSNHFDVCEFVQTVFSYLDNQASSSKIGSLHPDFVATLLLNSLEAHLVGIERAFVSSLPPADRIRNMNELFPRMAAANRAVREAQDTALLILNAPVARSGNARDLAARLEDSEFTKLIELAGSSDFLRIAFDQYSYHGFSGKVRRRSIVFNREGDTSWDWYWIKASHRMASEDQMQRLPLSLMEADIRKGMSERGVPEDFWTFYDNPGDLEWIRRAKLIREGVRSQVEDNVSKYFDLAARFETQQGPFTFGELIRGWSVLYGVAALARMHNLAASRAPGRGSFVVVTDRERLLSLLREEFSSDPTAPDRIISQFTSEVSSKSHVDLFYRPLLRLTDGTYLMPPTYVTASRFDRNVFTTAVVESDLDQKEKGAVPVRRAVSQFVEANFKATADFTADVAGQTVTDVDIAGFKNEHLFLEYCII